MAHCTIPGCTRKHFGKGLCNMHYSRLRRHGDTFDAVVMRVHADLDTRFESKVDRSNADGCWIWTGAPDKDGYGFLMVRPGDGKVSVVKAHRMAYEREYGPIPSGLCVLHRCDNPACVRPSHLFLGTQLDNLADMRAKGRAVEQKRRAA